MSSVWILEKKYGGAFERVCAEESREEIDARAAEYAAAQPGPQRIRRGPAEFAGYFGDNPRNHPGLTQQYVDRVRALRSH